MQDSAAGYDVFLSYSRADSAAAETLRARLNEAGLSAFLDRYGLLPGLGKDDVPVGCFLGLNTWVDLRSGLDEHEALQRLVSGAQGEAIDAAAASKLLAGLSPYRGLLPFREQDAGLFFGRKRFVDELVQKVGQRTATNVVAVVGRSGSGKSSIVYAGLIPALRGERGVGEECVWRIVDLRPHDEPLNQLALAFDPPKDENARWRGSRR